MNKPKKSFKEKFRDFKFRLRIFLWFLVTEPLKQLKEIGLLLYKIILSLNKALTWVYLSLLFMIVFLLLGNKYAAGLFLVFLLFLIIMWEWQRGYFMYKYREETKKRVKKKFKEENLDGGQKNGEWNNRNHNK